MKKQAFHAVKLGLFVLTGLVLLLFSLYVLGKGRNFFGNRFEVKTRFEDVNSLLVGNNVRLLGIDVGSVRRIEIWNDTTIEVTMNLNREMKNFIRSNAIASLGTDGLIGNRVVNISPPPGLAPFLKGGEMLASRQEVDTELMLQTLYKTNENVAKIAEEVRNTIHLVNTSSALTSLLNDKSLPTNLRASLVHLRNATENASILTENVAGTLRLASEGKGTLAMLLTDTTLSMEFKQAIRQLKALENSTARLVNDLNQVVVSVEKDLNREGSNALNVLLRDSLLATRIRATMENIDRGSAAFADDMEALKSNFLFRRHFKKTGKKKASQAIPKSAGN